MIWATIGVLLFTAALIFLVTGGKNTYEFISFKPLPTEYDGVMTLKKTGVPTRFERLFMGRKIEVTEVQFVGGMCSWRTLPSHYEVRWLVNDVLTQYWYRWDYERKRQCS